MRGEAHQVHRKGLQIDLDLACALCRIHVKQDLFFPADLAQGGDVLDNADLVVHVHHRGEHGVIAQGLAEPVQVQQAVGLHVEVGDFETLALELAAGVEHRLVLGLDGDDVLATFLVEMGRALDGEVV